MRIESEIPDTLKVFSTKAIVGQKSYQKFSFKNETSEFKVLEFTSSNPDVFQLTDAKIPFNAGEEKEVSAFMPPMDRTGGFEVFIYINDPDFTYNQCLMFKISYTQH